MQIKNQKKSTFEYLKEKILILIKNKKKTLKTLYIYIYYFF